MKISLIALAILIGNSVALADLAESHQENCDTPKSKTLKGSEGSCRVVIAPKRTETKGYCQGTFNGNLPCVIHYQSTKTGGGMKISCGSDPKALVFDEDMEADAIEYNVATLFSQTNGEDIIVNDENTYSVVSNSLLTIMMTQSPSSSERSATIFITTIVGSVPLQDVNCF